MVQNVVRQPEMLGDAEEQDPASGPRNQGSPMNRSGRTEPVAMASAITATHTATHTRAAINTFGHSDSGTKSLSGKVVLPRA